MSMLNIAKNITKFASQDTAKLTEAKVDTQKLIDFAGEDLAKRFMAIKHKLKAPSNDLYYWIKNHTPEQLLAAVEEAENAKSNRQKTKETSDGAKLVADTKHWKVYHITTFEASKKYGRDTKWCITGIGGYGDKYWNEYTENDLVDFYFFITKDKYDPRGLDSKFALANYVGGRYEVFNQQDEQLESIYDIPFIAEVNIPGVDFDEIRPTKKTAFCYNCDVECEVDDLWAGPDGELYCNDCFYDQFFHCMGCGEPFSLGYENIDTYGNYFCDHCYSHNKDNTIKKFSVKDFLTNRGLIESASIIQEFSEYEKLWD